MKKIFVFCFMFLVFSFKVSASHLDLYRIDGVYSSQLDIDNNRYYSYRQNRYVMDGRTVYCVEPGIDINTREYYPYNLSYSSFSSDILDKLSLIGYFGYDYPGHQSDKYFLATQELVWELVGNNEAHFTTGINDTGDYINIDYEKNEIMSLVNKYYLKPSFDMSVVDGIIGDKLVLVDNNHVLSNYDVVSGNAYIDGDSLVIDVKDIDEIKLLRKKYDNNESVYYMASNSQDFMYLRAFDVYSSVRINGYIPYSNISIYKTGEVLVDFVDGEFIYEERGLDNIVFGLYAYDDIYINDELIYKMNDLIQELVTSNGYAYSINLPNGKYYLKELSAYDDLIIGDDILIELNNDSIDVYTYELDLKNDRMKSFININKQGEVFDDINNSHYEGLGGVKFGLYSHDDVYNFYDRLLIGKDKLINTFVTDVSGDVSIDIDLPISSYYLRELEAPDSYRVSDSSYDLEIKSDGFIEYYLDDSIYNDLKKGSVVVNKYDIYGNRLDGAYFKLLSGDDLIYEGGAVDGNICIDNLPYGQYKLFEVSAPDGYIKSDDIYDIFIDNDSIFVDVYNEKLPITSDIYFFRRLISYVSIFFGMVIYGKRIKDY